MSAPDKRLKQSRPLRWAKRNRLRKFKEHLKLLASYFIDENGGGAGVRLRKPTKEKTRKLKD